MEKPQTKEEMLIEITRLKKDNEDWEKANQNRLKEFAKAFNWLRKDYFSSSKELNIPTWPEIFVELGKLLASQRDLQYITRQENLNLEVEILRNTVTQLTQK